MMNLSLLSIGSDSSMLELPAEIHQAVHELCKATVRAARTLALRSDREVLLLRTDGAELIVRIIKPSHKVDIELTVSALAASAGIGPEPLGHMTIPDGRVVVAEQFLKAKKRASQDLPGRTRLLGECMSTLYSLPTTILSQKSPDNYDLLGRLGRWIDEAALHGIEGVKDMQSIVPEIRDASSSYEATVLHGDLRLENMIFDGVFVKLIDFEQAFCGDPRYDIAKLMVSRRQTLGQVTEIMDRSIGSSSVRDIEILSLYARIHAFAVEVWTRRSFRRH